MYRQNLITFVLRSNGRDILIHLWHFTVSIQQKTNAFYTEKQDETKSVNTSLNETVIEKHKIKTHKLIIVLS